MQRAVPSAAPATAMLSSASAATLPSHMLLLVDVLLPASAAAIATAAGLDAESGPGVRSSVQLAVRADRTSTVAQLKQTIAREIELLLDGQPASGFSNSAAEVRCRFRCRHVRKKDSATVGGAGYIVAQQSLRLADVMRDGEKISAEVEEEEGVARQTTLSMQQQTAASPAAASTPAPKLNALPSPDLQAAAAPVAVAHAVASPAPTAKATSSQENSPVNRVSSFPESLKESAVRILAVGGSSCGSGVLVNRRGSDGTSHYFVLTAGHVVHNLLARTQLDGSKLRAVMPAIGGVAGREAEIVLPCVEIRSAYPICMQLASSDDFSTKDASTRYDIAVIELGQLPPALERAALEVGNSFKRPCYPGMSLRGVFWDCTSVDEWRERAFKHVSVYSLTTASVQLDSELHPGASGTGLIGSNNELVAVLTSRFVHEDSANQQLSSRAALVTFFRRLLEGAETMPSITAQLDSADLDWSIQTISLVALPSAAAAAAADESRKASRVQARQLQEQAENASPAALDHSKRAAFTGKK